MTRDCCTYHLVEDCAAFLLKLKRLPKKQAKERDDLTEAMMLRLGEMCQEDQPDA